MRRWPTASASFVASGSFSAGSVTTKAVPPASETVVLSPVAIPAGSGFGSSSARQTPPCPTTVNASAAASAARANEQRQVTRCASPIIMVLLSGCRPRVAMAPPSNAGATFCDVQIAHGVGGLWVREGEDGRELREDWAAAPEQRARRDG